MKNAELVAAELRLAYDRGKAHATSLSDYMKPEKDHYAIM